jgi:hypothetical protein
MNELFILNLWYGDGFGNGPIVLASRSDAEEMALAFYQEGLYESFLRLLMVDGDAVKDALRWAYDDVDEYSIEKAAAFL